MNILKIIYWYLLLIISTVVILIFTYRAWNYDYTKYPIAYSHDGVESLKLIKNIAAGNSHWQTNYTLGFPQGSNLYVNFPTPDAFSLFLINFFTLFTKNHFLIYNLFIFTTYIFTSLSAFYILKKLSISNLLAFLLALSFSFIPFHQIRASVGHIFLTQYFTIPLAIYIGTLLMNKNSLEKISKAKFFEILLFIILISGTGTAYYQFFSILVWGVSALIHKISYNSWKSIMSFLIISGLTILLTALSVLPSLEFVFQKESSFNLIKRDPIQIEEFGLRFNRMIVPLPSTYTEILNPFLYNYYKNVQHEQFQFIGIPAIIGLIVILLLVFKKKSNQELKNIGFLSWGIMIFASSGGLAFIFGHLVSSSIRSYGRISIFLSFIGIYAFALLISKYSKKMQVSFYTLFILFSMFYQVSMFNPHQNAWNVINAFNEDRDITQKIEQSIETNSNILQLPLITYPEARGGCGFDSYDLFTPYLHTNNFNWSFGNVISQEEIDKIKIMIETENEQIDPQKLVDYAIAQNFNVIYIDVRSCLPSWDLQGEILKITNGKLHTSNDMNKIFIDISEYKNSVKM